MPTTNPVFSFVNLFNSNDNKKSTCVNIIQNVNDLETALIHLPCYTIHSNMNCDIVSCDDVPYMKDPHIRM